MIDTGICRRHFLLIENPYGVSILELLRRSFLLILLILLFLPFTSLAQTTDFAAHRQRKVILPSQLGSLSFADSTLYCYVPEVLLKARRNGEMLLSVQADTALVKLDEEIDYVVRHPSTGDLYFTTLDRKGRSYLFCCHEESNGKRKVSQVKMDGGFLDKGMCVYHPTFTADGSLMVFSSSHEDRNNGSLDLWYASFDKGEWSQPVNLGQRINTTGDEITPFLYHDCLLFASNGHADDNGHYALYATRLVTDRVGDTVGHRQIGRCLVQRLPEPFNVAGTHNLDLAFDTLFNCGYWISNRDDISGRQLYLLSGSLEGLLLWGIVSDKNDHPLAGVTVAASQDGVTLCSTTTDATGHYRLFLHCGQHYDLSFDKANFFVTLDPFDARQGDEGYLVTEQQHNVKLFGLPVGERFYFDDLFGPDADVEISARGREELAPLVQFLSDNPAKKVTMTLLNDLTDDPSFNSLLTQQRILTLEKYLRELLPSTVKFNISNACNGMEKCTSASGSSILTVLIDK